MNSKTALIVFAREPKEGKVKTRLCKDLPAPVVTRLYKAFIKDVLSVALKVRCDQRFIYYAGSGSSIPFLRKVGGRFQLKRQSGRDLGERMLNAFTYCQKKNFDRIVIIGTDCLTLTEQDIARAFKKLDSNDCILGPAKDGGYYLIALKHPYKEIFQGVRWGTSSVLKQTINRVDKLNKKTYLLNRREDIDTIVHLNKFSRSAKNPTTAIHTRRILKKLPLTS